MLHASSKTQFTDVDSSENTAYLILQNCFLYGLCMLSDPGQNSNSISYQESLEFKFLKIFNLTLLSAWIRWGGDNIPSLSFLDAFFSEYQRSGVQYLCDFHRKKPERQQEAKQNGRA